MNKICGSMLGLDYAKYCYNIELFIDEVKKSVVDKNRSFAYRHNIYTAYTVYLIMSATGHRPVKDPFCYISDFDLDENLVIVNDKNVSKSHENRLCWYSDVVREQLKNYVNYIGTLSEWASEALSEKFNNAINEGLSESQQKIPLFFFFSEDLKEIKSISSASINSLLAEFWPYEDNIQRHALESWLADKSIPSFFIDAQMGHHQHNLHPFGKKTSWSAAECGSVIIDSVEEVINEQGWKAIICPGIKPETLLNSQFNKIEFGHYERRTNRNNRLKKIEKKAMDIIDRELFINGNNIEIFNNKEYRENLRERVVSECEGSHRLLYMTLKLVDNYIDSGLMKSGFPNCKKYTLFKEDVSPFDGLWIRGFKDFKRIKFDFVKYLKNKDEICNRNNVNILWAEICMSSVLFGSLYRPEWLVDLLKNGPKGFCKVKKWNVFYDLWVDREKNKVDDSLSPDWRWQPDAVSKGLLYGMLENHGNANELNINDKAVMSCIKMLCLKVGITNVTNENACEVICKKSEKYWAYHQPQFINSIMKGTGSSVPVPRRVYARIIRKCRIKNNIVNFDDLEKLNAHPRYKNKSNKYKSSNNFKRSITSLFVRGVNATSSSRGRKVLLNGLDEILNNKTYETKINYYLACWLSSLCVYKKRDGSHLRFSSIKSYYYIISGALIDLVKNADIDEYGIDEIEDLYRNVIMYKYSEDTSCEHANNCKNRAIQISIFDKYLRKQFGLDTEELDWSSVSGEWVKYLDRKVNANLVTPSEYQAIILLITKLSDISDYKRNWLGAFIVFGYRFGLRVGEVCRLTRQDVQWQSEDVIVQVKSSKWGEAKSDAGTRQVPLIGKLTKLERGFVRGVLERSELIDERINSPIFTGEKLNNKLIDRHLVWEAVHAVIRHVIGDERIRFHHLRHGYGNGIFSMMFKDYGYKLIDMELDDLWRDKNNTANELLISGTGVDPRRLAALASVMGHADGSTSMGSYIHIADDVAVGIADKLITMDMSNSDLSKIIQVKPSLIDRRRRNCGASIKDGVSTLKSIQLNEKIDSFEFQRSNWPITLPVVEKSTHVTLNLIDRAYEMYGKRGMNAKGLSSVFNVSNDLLNEIINCGKLSEKKSKFYVYSLGGQLVDSWLDVEMVPRSSGISLEKEAFSEILNTADKIINGKKDNLSLLINASNIWADINQTSDDRYGFIVEGPNQLMTFLSGCYELGYSSKDFIASIPDDLDELEEGIAREKLHKVGVELSVSCKKIRKKSRGVGKTRRDRIYLSISRQNNGIVQFNKTLSRLFFLIYSWNNMSNKYLDSINKSIT